MKYYEELSKAITNRVFASLDPASRQELCKAIGDPRPIHKYINRQPNPKKPGHWVYTYTDETLNEKKGFIKEEDFGKIVKEVEDMFPSVNILKMSWGYVSRGLGTRETHQKVSVRMYKGERNIEQYTMIVGTASEIANKLINHIKEKYEGGKDWDEIKKTYYEETKDTKQPAEGKEVEGPDPEPKELEKAIGDPRAIHKYIKREKNPKTGKWIYFYTDPNTGKKWQLNEAEVKQVQSIGEPEEEKPTETEPKISSMGLRKETPEEKKAVEEKIYAKEPWEMTWDEYRNPEVGGTLGKFEISTEKAARAGEPVSKENLAFLTNNILEEIGGKGKNRQELAQSVFTKNKQSTPSQEKRWAYGTKTKKWELIGPEDRDYEHGIPQDKFAKMDKLEAMVEYLSPKWAIENKRKGIKPLTEEQQMKAEQEQEFKGEREYEESKEKEWEKKDKEKRDRENIALSKFYASQRKKEPQEGNKIKVTYPNQYQGKIGKIVEPSPSGDFFIVEISGKKVSMHSSDFKVIKNQ